MMPSSAQHTYISAIDRFRQLGLCSLTVEQLRAGSSVGNSLRNQGSPVGRFLSSSDARVMSCRTVVLGARPPMIAPFQMMTQLPGPIS
jgi:hypothetical protein